MKLFLGEYEHSLDDRSRVTLSRKIRQELNANQVILSKGFERCIFGFDIDRFDTEAEKQISIPVTDQKGRDMRRYMFAAAMKVDIDKLGRVLLPTHLKEYAQIQNSVMIVGAGDHFEIWDKNSWMKYQKRLEE